MNDDVTWLIEFYETVAAGGQMQWRETPTSGWQKTDIGPQLSSEPIDRKQWRIKRKPREWQLFIPDDESHEVCLYGCGYYNNQNLNEPGTVVRVQEVIK